MTYEVNFVKGRKGAACIHDSFALVSANDTGRPDVLGFIPVSEIPDKTQQDVLNAFRSAAEQTNSNDKNAIVTRTKRALQDAPIPKAIA